MTFSRTAPRHEIAYLRRRPKVGDQAAAPEPAAGPSLSLSRSLEREAPQAGGQDAGPSVRRARGRAILTRDTPVVTLDRRQSAIGSLAFDLVGGGALSCAWELDGGEAGLVSEALGVRVSPEFGRRPIVQLVDARLVVGLRHVRELRRLLVLAGGLPESPPGRLIGDLLDGSTVESAHAGPRPVIAALALYQVAGELVIRREDEGFDGVEKAASAYGFSLTWLPPVER